ncbi:MAG TPA: enoyl-CoA hydratase-related protein [Bryobacteraceae bacterium]|nr:enoyl-CoA hydratase-related protein [Bryobacteraceae bacterium]
MSEHIARIVLNRPEKRNALNAELVTRISAGLAEAAADPDTRVVLISGEGADFCSGADLAELRAITENGPAENLASARALGQLFVDIRRHRCPVIAAVRGRALAGGCGLATACDVVLAAESAQFGYPEVNIGFVPAMVMALLRRQVPEKRAFELLALGQVIGAREAAAFGLVNAVFSEATFDDDVATWVNRLARKPPGAVAMTKSLLYQGDGLSFETAIDLGAHANALARTTEECREGVRRFLEGKR